MTSWIKTQKGTINRLQWDRCPLFLFAFPVYKVFENVAQKYDVMNDAMSLGIHRVWKDMLLHAMHPQPGVRLLDVAGGTGKAVCRRRCKTAETPAGVTLVFCLLWPSPAGDIAFRFLEYVRSQQERHSRRAARSMQTPSWQDISNSYTTEDEDVPKESRAVVCDINKEMLRVGKQKADSMGISAGMFLTVKLLQVTQHFTQVSVCRAFVRTSWSVTLLAQSIKDWPVLKDGDHSLILFSYP